jgi:hypothetical protein
MIYNRIMGISGARSLVVVTVGVLAPAMAHGQPAPPPPPAPRHGLVLGAALWGGNISCESDTDGGCGDSFRKAGGLDLDIGYLFTPRLGVVLDVWAMGSSEDDVGITYVATTINARFWLVPILWIQGGVGAGHAIVNVGPFEARGDDVPVGQLAAGLEIVRARSWMLDVQVKAAQGTATDEGSDGVTTGRAVGVGLGFTWFASR